MKTKIYVLKKKLLIPDHQGKLIKLPKGKRYYYLEKINRYKKRIIICQKYEKITTDRVKCIDCIVLNRKQLAHYFEELEIKKKQKETAKTLQKDIEDMINGKI